MVISELLRCKVGPNQSNNDFILDDASQTSCKTWAENIQSDRIEEANRIRESMNKSIRFSEQEGNITCFLRSIKPSHKPRRNNSDKIFRHSFPSINANKFDKSNPKQYSQRTTMKPRKVIQEKRVRMTPSA